MSLAMPHTWFRTILDNRGLQLLTVVTLSAGAIVALSTGTGSGLTVCLHAQGCCSPENCNEPYPDCVYWGQCDLMGSTNYCDYPDSYGCPTGQVAEGCWCVYYNTPILIDVVGDGFALTDVASGVPFAIGPTDFVYRVAWTEPLSDDSWLALDRNGNGTIDNGQELFGNFTPQPELPAAQHKHGFLALAQFDAPANGGNGDGVIGREDSVYRDLRLWQDVNHNGRSESRELHALDAVGIESIDLNYRESRRRDEFGNLFRYRAKIVAPRSAAGDLLPFGDASWVTSSRWAVDVYLRVSRMR